MSPIWRSHFFAQNALAILIGLGDDPLSCGRDTGDEWRGRQLAKFVSRRGFVGAMLIKKLSS
jgi:hypothetical protein